MGWFERPEFGPNVGLIDEMYRKYLDDPESVSEAWREFFAENEPDEDGEAQPEPAEGRPEAEQPRATAGAARRQDGPPARPERPAPAEADRGPEQQPEARAKPEQRPEGNGGPGREATAKAGTRQPAAKDGTEAEPEEPTEQTVPLRGAAARIVQAMEASRAVPTATSV
ncbi:MAG TPA: multifunctional oxoglutarate decarboxylase/oxoglutarate dehydrogenase thiamine pyrophosphate-binding subunit/dihydrolipoyllysine-residue succinyltransferase subunit, partial [Actinomycetes bacterium]|nr:multifunctional oxoglutarate decarboxylase/oxoglutarate dehydrogenase thiamine pyrophosphate-binding subunit/dihydrolipoyllysine-residue succinyltransferase subunit [Actinomycetes bacterium]